MAHIFTDSQVFGYPLKQVILFFTYFFLFCFSGWGQTYSKKSVKLTDQGIELLKSRDFDQAIYLFHKAIAIDSSYPIPYLRLGSWYAQFLEKDSAALYYNEYVQKVGANAVSEDLRTKIARLNFETGNYFASYDLLKSLSSPDSLLLKSVLFSIEAIKTPIKVTISPLPAEVNQYEMQYFPVLTVDEQTIIFTKRDGVDPGFDEDLVVATKQNGDWKQAKSISEKINTRYNEGASTISADGRILIFTACEGRKTFGNCDLYISIKTGENWSQPENLGSAVNSKFWDSQPSLSADGRTIYFSSNRPGGYGKRDIWISRMGPKGWEEPVNLGPLVNSSEDETTPFIHANNKQLFFSSNGHPGLGGYDLYYSEKTEMTWNRPVNLGFPINTCDDELAMYINRSGQHYYYSAETTSGGKVINSEIVSFSLENQNFVNARAAYIIGEVYDEHSNEPLAADIRLTNLNDSTDIYFVKADSLTGQFFLVLTENAEYGAFISRKGYLFDDYSFKVASTLIDSPDTINFPLRQILVGQSLTVDNIYFEFNSSDLNRRSFSELLEIVRFLKENSETCFLIQGHTDNVGSPAFNLKLSEDRARVVYNYLIKQGVSAKRLRFQGFGSTFPIADNSTEQGRRINRRITFELINIP